MSAIVKSNPTENKYLIGAELEALRNVQKALPFLSAPKMYRLKSMLKGLFAYLNEDYTKVVYLKTGEIVSSRLIVSVFDTVKGGKKLVTLLKHLEGDIPFSKFNNGVKPAKIELSPFAYEGKMVQPMYVKGMLMFYTKSGDSVWDKIATYIGGADRARIYYTMLLADITSK